MSAPLVKDSTRPFILSKTKLVSFISVFACALLVLASGHPLINSLMPAEVLWPCLFLLLALLSIRKKLIFKRRELVVGLGFLAIALLQIAMLGGGILPATTGFLLMLGSAILGVRSIDSFHQRYVDLMLSVCGVSLVFYSLRMAGAISSADFLWLPGAQLENGWVHAWIFNFQKESEAYRNSGIFWEPGAFAGYITVALLLTAVSKATTPHWKVGVLVLALLTTMSTTGFLALVPIALLMLLGKGRVAHPLKVALMCCGAISLMVAFLIAYQRIPFLAQKIEYQNSVVSRSATGYEITRIGSAVYDLDSIRERPLIGWSASLATRERGDPKFEQIAKSQGNGFTGFAAKFGIPALMLYLWAVYTALYRFSESRVRAAIGVGVVSLLLFGEQFLNFPVFWCVALLSEERWLLSRR